MKHFRYVAPFVVTAILASCATVPRAASTSGGTSTLFKTSFEEEDAPARVGTSSGFDTRIAGGPREAYNARQNVGFTGIRSLEYSGHSPASGEQSATLYDVNIPLTGNSVLSYRLFPQFEAEGPGYLATSTAIDLIFSDGTRLSDTDALDQHGFRVNAKAQGESKTLYTNQWNHKEVHIGAIAGDKTVRQIVLRHDGNGEEGAFRGWVDDLRIANVSADVRNDRFSEHVLTTRGTNSSGRFSRGNNIPATAVPHAFNFWSPMTDASSLSWFYEYSGRNDANNRPRLEALTLTHETSPWMGDRQTFQFMPSIAPGIPSVARADRSVSFEHENEIAQPHYYRVKLDNEITAEIAPADHAAIFRFTFPGDQASLIFDNVDHRGGLTLAADSRELSAYTETRSGLSNGATRMFIYAKFDQPVTASAMLVGRDGGDGKRPRDNAGYLRFSPGADRTVTMRIATSLISLDQAKRNLALEISDTDRFEDVRARAQAEWDRKLSVVQVEGATADQRTTLYSNLYRLFLYPNSAHENVGTADAPIWKHAIQSSASSDIPPGTTTTHTGADVVDGKLYVNNGFWDTYRTVWAAQTLLAPEMAGELVNGFLQHSKDGGWVPRWSSPGYANLMTGTSSDVAFADAFLKGAEGIDLPLLYTAAIRNASVAPENQNIGRKGMERAPFIGYTPSSVGEGVSWALEGYINDFGIANMLEAMSGLPNPPHPPQRLRQESEYYLRRSQAYVNMFDRAVGFFQGRAADGQWKSKPGSYDPRVWGHQHDYTETNGWGFAFLVPHDGEGLANLYGGRPALARKLDEYFSTPETARFPGSYGGVIHEMVEARDVRMGQWGFSNQVAHHVPWMYLYAQRPSRTQEIVRETLSRMYVGSEIGQGYPGDEDNGESSAWWLFAALGFYPLQVGSENLVIGSPLFTKATINFANGRKLIVRAANNSSRNRYVHGVKVNGQAWSSTSIPHSVLAKGGEIEFEMAAAPGTWGSDADAVPPSVSRSGTPAPLVDRTAPNGDIHISALSKGEASLVIDNDSATEVSFPAGSTMRFRSHEKRAPTISYYTLTSGSKEGYPMAWRLDASNDGRNWVKVDERSREKFEWSQYTRPFRLRDPANYREYRLTFIEAGNSRNISLSEFELLGSDEL